jgi:hypothetical protein
MLSDIPKIARNEISVTKCKEYCAIWLKICFWIDTKNEILITYEYAYLLGRALQCIISIIKLFNKD